MDVITDPEALAAARAAFGRVFTGTTRRRAVFRDAAPARLLLFPTGNGYALDEQYLTAVAAAARTVGDDTALIASYVFNWDEEDAIDQWLELGLDDLDPYFDNTGPQARQEHALVSPAGRWGVLTTDEEEAFVGGSPAFLQAMLDALGRSDDADVDEWLARWRHNRRSDFEPEWIPDLLRHLYGDERAGGWLADGWPPREEAPVAPGALGRIGRRLRGRR